MFKMQVKMKVNDSEWEWRDVHPTGGKPYQYETKAEADKMLDMCYPMQTNDQARVIAA